mmetsp:Transcript_927/g.2918  ORF Transcript_927/g.2918 Transcript_927/m.2918 type:complete len:282 (+) Transcript_927:2175-3020(+)
MRNAFDCLRILGKPLFQVPVEIDRDYSLPGLVKDTQHASRLHQPPADREEGSQLSLLVDARFHPGVMEEDEVKCLLLEEGNLLHGDPPEGSERGLLVVLTGRRKVGRARDEVLISTDDLPASFALCRHQLCEFTAREVEDEAESDGHVRHHSLNRLAWRRMRMDLGVNYPYAQAFDLPLLLALLVPPSPDPLLLAVDNLHVQTMSALRQQQRDVVAVSNERLEPREGFGHPEGKAVTAGNEVHGSELENDPIALPCNCRSVRGVTKERHGWESIGKDGRGG